MSSIRRIAVASLIQETNTFSLLPSTYADFESQGIWFGEEIFANAENLNLEISGAISRLRELDFLPVPIMRAWAMSGGVLKENDFNRMRQELLSGLRNAGKLDGVILNLHGALVVENEFQGDARIVEDVRGLVGNNIPLIVTHDLHANLGERIVAAATAVIGYKTYPHVDQGATGARAAELVASALERKSEMSTILAKVNMLIPAEIQPILEYPMSKIRKFADSFLDSQILDISLFPVQPWLDVPELGFGFAITHLDADAKAQSIVNELVKVLWSIKDEFRLKLLSLNEAIAKIQGAKQVLPYILVHSADAPPGGASGDDASVLSALLSAKPPITAAMTLVDSAGVGKCFEVGAGAKIELTLGASIDSRWSRPVHFSGKVARISSDPILLTGPVMNGQKVSMGRWATLDSESGVSVLVTERPAPTFDPSAYIQAGIEIDQLQAVQVRSCALFRSGFAGLFQEALILDLAGSTTPNFSSLDFHNIPRPMFGLDSDISQLEDRYS